MFAFWLCVAHCFPRSLVAACSRVCACEFDPRGGSACVGRPVSVCLCCLCVYVRWYRPRTAWKNCICRRYFTSPVRGIGSSFQLAITAPQIYFIGYGTATAQSQPASEPHTALGPEHQTTNKNTHLHAKHQTPSNNTQMLRRQHPNECRTRNTTIQIKQSLTQHTLTQTITLRQH